MPKPASIIFSEWLRSWRKANRYSLDQFAQLSGVSKVALFELERGTTLNPRLTTLMAISKATGTAVSKIAAMCASQKLQEGGSHG
ncbi:helix-turn-helix domain-containing protein [Xanthomonas sacchari]|uniref:helix-turn-helix domain-containing protein n=1 Tax=Xanthomonas sacchari TaxID=56458 RepID=UPI00224FF039|nr:helix-turn-helix domain-containing protein [Xanthomonas sacchari]MCW0370232.1 hypothetical protein [Xanthomonas sacchari]